MKISLTKYFHRLDQTALTNYTTLICICKFCLKEWLLIRRYFTLENTFYGCYFSPCLWDFDHGSEGAELQWYYGNSMCSRQIYSRTSHVLTVTWLDFYCAVWFYTIQKSEWAKWHHCRNRVTWLSRYEKFYLLYWLRKMFNSLGEVYWCD